MKRSGKNEIKKLLPLAFQVGDPPGKGKFLEECREKILLPPVSFRKFVGTQATYISGKVWLLSAIAAVAAISFGAVAPREKWELLWLISALTPLLALSLAAENVRSEMYGMAELELAARFSLKHVALARMGVLGAVHFVLLVLFVLLCGMEGRMLQTAVYIFVPYLVTVTGSLMILRRVRGRESVYACGMLTVVVAVVPALAFLADDTPYVNLYGGEYFGWWLAAFFLLVAAAAREVRERIAQTRQMTWEQK